MKKLENYEDLSHENVTDMDDQVKYWSDYMTTPLHPRSTLLINEFLHETT